MDFPQTQLQKQTEHFQPMLHFHVTTTPISYFPLKKNLDEKFWFRGATAELQGEKRLQTLLASAAFMELTAWPGLFSGDNKAEKVPLCLQINHLWYSESKGRCFYPAEDCWGNHYLSCFDIYTLSNNYFPVMTGTNLSFSIWPEGVRLWLIIDKAILMAAERQHHLWCWTGACKPWSPPSHSRWKNKSL